MDLNTFEKGSLLFRPFAKDDFNDLHSILGNKEVCKYLPVSPAYTENQVVKILSYFIDTFIIAEKNLHYAVIHIDTGSFIGYCGCSYIKEYDCNEIEYFLNPKFYGNGYASLMALAMKEVATKLSLTHLVGLAALDNIPSQKILEKIGYIYKKDVTHWGMQLKLYELKL